MYFSRVLYLVGERTDSIGLLWCLLALWTNLQRRQNLHSREHNGARLRSAALNRIVSTKERRRAMAFKDLMDKAKGVANNATEAAGKLVDEFNEALPTMRALGFTIKDLRVGTGLVPEIGAKLIASTETIDVKKVKELIDKHAENKTLVGAL